MEAVRPAKLIDPVCGMSVDVAAAEAAGLLLEYEGRTFAFCRSGCRRAFVEEPATYVAKAEAAGAGAGAGVRGGPDHAADDHHAATDHHALPVIDEGMRRWYESCACCLSDAFPEIKAQLDAERAAAALGPVDPGICEVAEAEPVTAADQVSPA
jgi:YHS domain-containing protein